MWQNLLLRGNLMLYVCADGLWEIQEEADNVKLETDCQLLGTTARH